MEYEKAIQVRLAPNVVAKIEQIKKDSGAKTTKEVFKNALATYAVLQDVREKDGSVIVEHNGKRIRIVIP